MTMVVYASECVSENNRAFGSIIIWLFYSLGAILLALKSMVLEDWRRLMVYSSLPYLVIVPVIWFLPESIAWLFEKRDEKKIREALKIMLTINRVKEKRHFTFNPSYKNSSNDEVSLMLIFKPLKICMKTLSLASGWVVTAMCFLGVSLAAQNLTGNLHRDFMLINGSEIIACFMAIYLSSRIGRKKPCMVCLMLCGICLIVVGLLPNQENQNIYIYLRLTLGIIGKLLAAIVYAILYSWTAELHPTFLRSCASGFHQTAGSIGMMVAPWTALWLHHYHIGLPFFAMGSLAIIAGCMLVNINETKGMKLSEDLNECFDDLLKTEETINSNNDSTILVIESKEKAKESQDIELKLLL